jgi:uncharacterized membrane protein
MDFVVSEANALLESPLLRRIAPLTLNGYARFRAIIDQDGALPARVKALYVATAATTKGYRTMALRELERARQLGLELEEATAAAIVLSSVRGEGAALCFIEALEAVYPGRISGEAPLLATLLGIWLLHDDVGPRLWLGGAMVLGGVLAIALRALSNTRPPPPEEI